MVEKIKKYELMLHTLGKKSTFQILDLLSSENFNYNFNQIKKNLKITSSNASSCLRELSYYGLIKNKKTDSSSIYTLSPIGKIVHSDLMKIFETIDNSSTLENITVNSIIKILSKLGEREYNYIVEKLKMEFDTALEQCQHESHELKEVLFGIYGNASMAIINDIEEEIQKNLSSTEALTKLINDV